jgi:hypothetical protein
MRTGKQLEKKIIRGSLAEQFELIRKRITRLEKKIIEPSVTIKIRDNKGKWQQWTGIFQLEDREKISILIADTLKHFEKHFNNERYSGKRFGIFTKTKQGEKLYKEIEVDEKK